jgi:cyclopropane-fatty-acyl-phospholipid synthase
MRAIMNPIVRRFSTIGTFRVRWPDGAVSVYQGEAGPDVTLVVRNWGVVRRMLLNPAMAIGECYMDGGLEPVGCTIYEVLDLLMRNIAAEGSSQPILTAQIWLGRITRRLAQWNPASRARAHVAHHYDLDGRLYRLFLDTDQQYSCAYFPNGDETLEQAQIAKKRHIAAKLLLDRPGLEVLDIGSGWGGLALTLARDHGARVTGITLSTEQLEVSRARAAAEGLSDQVRFEMLDYRSLNRRFDRIVSVGMFEHVGVGYFSEFFRTVQRSLAPDGVMLLHTIGRSRGPGSTNPWFKKYIFPGGYAPALSEVMPALERSGLIATDVEVWRLHYAQTLHHWRARFSANREAIVALHDERFARMFEFYFAGSELAFRHNGQVVFQIQLARRQDAVPLSRNYLHTQEPAREFNPVSRALQMSTIANPLHGS